ncbi:hypothetical protein DB30_05428 [Enhygromyxa salina]|uniref:Uncharacterized protein n=1 Tax=Enhygromyxa salina TaxID=215803 RepID=A0A0C2D1J5_9BACT|nr:hypothetical protein DB30_05428 [Enhygromyxa salina]
MATGETTGADPSGTGTGISTPGSVRGTAEAGATSLVLVVDQIHAGSYKGNAILDRDQNLQASLLAAFVTLVEL